MSSHDDDSDLDDLLDEFAAEVLSKPPGEAPAADEPVLAAAAVPAEKAIEAPVETKTAVSESATAPTTKAPTSKTLAGAEDPSVPELDEDFAEQFKQGMDFILEGMKDDPEAKQSFEALLANLSKSTGSEQVDGAAGSAVASSSGAAAGEKGFQDTISQTMNRLKTSQDELNAKSASAADDDFLVKMLKDLESAAGSSSGSELDGVLAEMLKELSSKAVLYEPMKEMHDKFPAWLKEHGDKITDEERTRYAKQQKIVDEIVAIYDDPKYSDDNQAARQRLNELMEEMQSSGNPPQELIGDLAAGSIPGFDPTSLDGAGGAADGCPVQ